MPFRWSAQSLYSLAMTDPAAENKDQLLIDLNFVPNWARKPPSEHGYTAPQERPESHGRDDRRGPPRAGGYGSDRPRRDDRDRRTGPRPGRDRVPPPGHAPAPPDPRLEAIEINFLPERRGLAPLAHRLARSVRAYSLFEVASLFLSKPEFFAVKIDLHDSSAAGSPLFQCSECKSVFLEREAAAVHAFARHFDKVCRKEEQAVEGPKGNFVCVARCTLSGTLLGPPNHHGFNDRVMEVHRLKYPEMPFEAYRKRIENVHDAQMIETWKQEMTRKVIYHFGEGEKAVTFERFSEAEAWFREHCLPSMVREGLHFVMPGTDIHGLEDVRLRGRVEEALQNETRFPLKLSITLRLAFRHLGLHTFKSGGGHTFLTAVVPNPIDPQTAVPLVREILEFTTAHPGCTTDELVKGLRPGLVPAVQVPATADSVPQEAAEAVVTPPAAAPTEAAPVAPAAEGVAPELKEVATQLRWLVEKGHVIEFWDGRLAVPRDTVARVQTARPHGHREGRRGK